MLDFVIDFNQLWNSTAPYSVVAISCYYLYMLFFTRYPLNPSEIHKDVQVCPPGKLQSKPEDGCCGTAVWSNSSATPCHAVTSAGTASSVAFCWATVTSPGSPSSQEKGSKVLTPERLVCAGALCWAKSEQSVVPLFIFLLSQNCTSEDESEHGTGICQEHKESDFCMTA